MWLLYAEAFGAMLILILIVWWTMFHGRHKGERARVGRTPAGQQQSAEEKDGR